MKKTALFIICILSMITPLCAEEFKISFTDSSGGLNMFDPPLKVRDNQCQDAQNTRFDDGGQVSSINGFSTFLTMPEVGTILGAIEYIPGTGEKYFVIQIDSNVYATKDAGSTWITVIEGLKTIFPCNFTVLDGEVWGTNGFDDVFSWNVSTTSTYGFIPKGRFITTHFGQLVLANTANQTSGVYLNEPYWGAKDVKGWVSGKYFFYINKDDGDEISGVASFKNDLICFKTKATYGLQGYGQNIMLTNFSNEFGCIDSRTIQERGGRLKFASKKGICEFANGFISTIDKNVENLTRNINVSKSTIVSKKWTQNMTTQFGLGESSNAIVLNNVITCVPLINSEGVNDKNTASKQESMGVASQPSWFYTRENMQEDYAPFTGGTVGTLVEISENHFNTISLPIEGSIAGLRLGRVSLNLARITPEVFQASVTVRVYDSASVLKAEQTRWISDLGIGSWYVFFDSYTFTITETFSLRAYYNSSGTNNTGVSALVDYQPFTRNEYMTATIASTAQTSWEAARALEGWELVSKKPASYQGGVLYYYYKMAKPISPPEKLYKSVVSKYNYEITPSTWAYYISQQFNAGTAITAWKNFLAVDDGGSTSYFVRYATGSTALSAATWVPILNGGLIQATTNQYWIQWRAVLNNRNQKIYSVTIDWLEGQTSNFQSPSAIIFNDDYLLSYSTYGITNTSVITIDRNGAYSKYKGVNAGIFIEYDNNLYFTGATDNKVYKLFDTRNFGSSAIDKYFITKDFGLLDRDSKIEKISITVQGSGTLVVGYKGNYDTAYSTFPVVMISSGTRNEVISVESGSAQQYWNIKCSNTASNEWFKVLMINVYLKPEELYAR